MNLKELKGWTLDHQMKGVPGNMKPMALARTGGKGWNILDEDLPLPAAVLLDSALTQNSAWMRRLSGLVDASVLIIRAEGARPAVAVRYRDAILKAGGNLAGFVFVGRRFYIPRWLYRRL